jgi:hypothetical protein
MSRNNRIRIWSHSRACDESRATRYGIASVLLLRVTVCSRRGLEVLVSPARY